jgi:hypothetical protein
MEEVEQAVVRPVERVDAERALALGKAQRHRDEEAALEGADLGDVARNPELGLSADDVAANRRGEGRGHAAHGLVALRDIAIDGGTAGRECHASS